MVGGGGAVGIVGDKSERRGCRASALHLFLGGVVGQACQEQIAYDHRSSPPKANTDSQPSEINCHGIEKH